jgi:hypothetical protein
MADVVLCFIYYPHSGYVSVFSSVYRFCYPYYFKMARIWAKFILFEWGFTIKSKSQVLEPDKVI